ncbi:34180_t:CDS:2, partial [Racocetra persica]
IVNQSDEPSEFDEFDEFDEYNKPDEFDESNERLKIISEFMAANMRIPELSIILKEYTDTVYRYASEFLITHEIIYRCMSKYIKTQEIAQQYNNLDAYGSIPVTIAEIPVDVT